MEMGILLPWVSANHLGPRDPTIFSGILPVPTFCFQSCLWFQAVLTSIDAVAVYTKLQAFMQSSFCCKLNCVLLNDLDYMCEIFRLWQCVLQLIYARLLAKLLSPVRA